MNYQSTKINGLSNISVWSLLNIQKTRPNGSFFFLNWFIVFFFFSLFFFSIEFYSPHYVAQDSVYRFYLYVNAYLRLLGKPLPGKLELLGDLAKD